MEEADFCRGSRLYYRHCRQKTMLATIAEEFAGFRVSLPSLKHTTVAMSGLVTGSICWT